MQQTKRAAIVAVGIIGVVAVVAALSAYNSKRQELQATCEVLKPMFGQSIRNITMMDFSVNGIKEATEEMKQNFYKGALVYFGDHDRRDFANQLSERQLEIFLRVRNKLRTNYKDFPKYGTNDELAARQAVVQGYNVCLAL